MYEKSNHRSSLSSEIVLIISGLVRILHGIYLNFYSDIELLIFTNVPVKNYEILQKYKGEMEEQELKNYKTLKSFKNRWRFTKKKYRNQYRRHYSNFIYRNQTSLNLRIKCVS